MEDPFWNRNGTVGSYMLICSVHCPCWLQERCARSHLLWFRHVNRIVQWCGRELLTFYRLFTRSTSL